MDHPLRTHEVNATGSLMVLEAARREGATVVFSSSASVYGDSPLNPKREDQSVAPISLYGAQKVLAENCLAAYSGAFGVRTVSLRYFNVFGPRQDPGSPYSGVISIFLQKALSGDPLILFGGGSQTRDFVAVEDVVRANLACLEQGSGVYNIGTGKETSILELAKAIVHTAGSSSEIIAGPSRAADIARSCADIDKAERELGFVPQADFEGSLANTLGSLRKEQTPREAR
jgi:UDP-glucose 4-epimerase